MSKLGLQMAPSVIDRAKQGGGASVPIPNITIEQLQKAYPGKTEAELKAAYKKKYGEDLK